MNFFTVFEDLVHFRVVFQVVFRNLEILDLAFVQTLRHKLPVPIDVVEVQNGPREQSVLLLIVVLVHAVEAFFDELVLESNAKLGGPKNVLSQAGPSHLDRVNLGKK